MAEHDNSDALKERLALYALGALDPAAAEQVAAEVRAAGGQVAQELRAMELVVEMLGYSAPPVRPRPELQQRLLDRLELQTTPAESPALPTEVVDAFSYIRSHEGEWVEFCPGVAVKTLSVDPTTQRRVALVRMDAGTQLPPHQHLDDEEVFVISGDCHITPEQTLYAGDYFKAEAGSWHDMTVTQEGTLFLTIFRNEFAI